MSLVKITEFDRPERMRVTEYTKGVWNYVYKDAVYVLTIEWGYLALRHYQMSRGKNFRKPKVVWTGQKIFSRLEGQFAFMEVWRPDFLEFCKVIGYDPEPYHEANIEKMHPFFARRCQWNWSTYHDGYVYTIKFENYASFGWGSKDMLTSQYVYKHGARSGLYAHWDQELSVQSVPFEERKFLFTCIALGKFDDLRMCELL